MSDDENRLCGVDEAGRGPLCGPVIAAAVILDPDKPIEGVRDSKKLSENQREALYGEICEKALDWSVGRADVFEIDHNNILNATLLAMKRAVMGLTVYPGLVQIDGRFGPDIPYTVENIIRGDEKVAEIGAASIIAKVSRDREMVKLAEQYPGYGIERHKGYPTEEHLEALAKFGVTPIHRTSFKPVSDILEGKVR